MNLVTMTSFAVLSAMNPAGEQQYVLSVIEDDPTPLAANLRQPSYFTAVIAVLATALLVFAVWMYVRQCKVLQLRLKELKFRERTEDQKIRSRWNLSALREQIHEVEMDAVSKISTE